MSLCKKSVEELEKLSELIVEGIVRALEKRGVFGGNTTAVNNAGGKPEKSPYQKTESLLYNYCGFKKIVRQKELEIEEIKTHGVPGRSGSIVQYSPHSGTVQGTVLPEESVEAAVRNVQESIVGMVQAIDFVDKGMEALKTDPYYKVLEMLYFEGRSQEDIAIKFGCTQATISNNKNRLVRELSMRLFPNQTAEAMMR